MPVRCFPARFAPHGWQGPRIGPGTSREDLFQQLVGDALIEAFGLAARVLPTAGRDGSIDAWIEEDAADATRFPGVSLPAIVECKDHDDTRGGFAKNVAQVWTDMAKKLAHQAGDGWPGAFSPWRRARGYVYCVSGCFASEHARDELEETIRLFFRTLPDGSRPPVNEVRVLDWSDLRAWMDKFPRLADRWLGVGLPLILDFNEYRAGLSGFQRYIESDQMPFMTPPPDSPIAPATLLDRLETRLGSGGVLLAGPGGVGKTRTAFEVARLANAQGWRVLYLMPGEPGIDFELLSDAVLSGSDRTVLVTDYLDQAQRLDLGAVRTTLLPAALARGIPTAILATTRPGWLLHSNSERDALLDRVELQPTPEQRDAIIAHAMDFVAPQAVRLIGREELRRLCGERPIFALLVARELERQAQTGRLSASALPSIRQGDLTYWLTRRLDEDDLRVPTPQSVLLPARPRPEVVAAAAALACAPHTRDAVERSARAAADALNVSADTAYLVRVLETLGWLELRDGQLSPAHDVVADELLTRVLFDAGNLRHAELEAVLAGCLGNPRTFGHLATGLARVLDDLDARDADALAAAACAWLTGHVHTLAATFAAADPETSSYALAAALARSPWDSLLISSWDAVIVPWLDRYQTHAAARHLLYNGLRKLPAGRAGSAVAASLAWLRSGDHGRHTSLVLSPLAAREDLAAEVRDDIVSMTLQWIESNMHRDEVRFPLRSVLSRIDLRSSHADRLAELTRAVDLARVWFQDEKRAVSLAACSLLPVLTTLPTLSPENRQFAMSRALAWLDHYRDRREATYVLGGLLKREDLGFGPGSRRQERDRIIALSFAWLATFGEILDACHLLGGLLKRTDLRGGKDEGADERGEAISRAFAWLKIHRSTQEATHVLAGLTGRHDLLRGTTADGGERGVALQLAAEWLDHPPIDAEPTFVLSQIISRTDLSAEELQHAVRRCLGWLRDHDLTLSSGFVLPPLLRRRDLDYPTGRAAIHHANRWLGEHAKTPDAEFVFKYLLRRPELDEKSRAVATAAAMRRLRVVLCTDEARFLFKSILGTRTLDPEVGKAAVGLALEWLKAFPHHPEGDWIFNLVLRLPYTTDAEWIQAAPYALTWLREQPRARERDRAMYSLLRRPHLLADDVIAEIAEAALTCSESRHFIGVVLDNLVTIVRTDRDRDRVTAALAQLGSDLRLWQRLTGDLRAAARRPPDLDRDTDIVERCLRMSGDVLTVSPIAAGVAVPAFLALRDRVHEQFSARIVEFTRSFATCPLVDDWYRGRVVSEVLELARQGHLKSANPLEELRSLGFMTGVGSSEPEHRASSSAQYRKVPIEWQHLTDALMAAARDGESSADIGPLVTKSLNQVHDMLRRSPAMAAFAIVPLLAVRSRVDEETRDRIVGLVRGIVADWRFQHRQRAGLARALKQAVDDGLLPGVDFDALLYSVGLSTTRPAVTPEPAAG